MSAGVHYNSHLIFIYRYLFVINIFIYNNLFVYMPSNLNTQLVIFCLYFSSFTEVLFSLVYLFNGISTFGVYWMQKLFLWKNNCSTILYITWRNVVWYLSQGYQSEVRHAYQSDIFFMLLEKPNLIIPSLT